MTVLAQLESARALVVQGWCQGAYARDAAGRSLKKCEAGAVRWCLAGALGAVGAFAYDRAYQLVRMQVIAELGFGCLLTWNDRLGRTQADATKLFDMAIAAERARA